jgi:hypothetical protein
MKRFVIAASLAVVLGLSFASNADAQYIYRYNTITPRGGVASTTQLYNLGAYQSYNTYVSPFGTVKQRNYYGDVFGNSYGASTGYNAYSGYGYNRGYYLPSPFVTPSTYPGYYYNYYRRY